MVFQHLHNIGGVNREGGRYTDIVYFPAVRGNGTACVQGDDGMIRTLAPEELERILELKQAAFSVCYTEQELRDARKWTRTEQYLGYYFDGKLSAQLEIVPLQVYIQGVPFAMGGIAQVASSPQLRRRGMASKLLVRSLEEMRANGMSVSMLNPYSYAFYRKFGWEIFSVEKMNTLDMQDIPRLESSERGEVRKLGKADWCEAGMVYNDFARKYNGMLVRDEEWWSRNVFRRKPGGLAVYCREDGAPAGYLLYAIKERSMIIYEIACLSEGARHGLWQFVRNHDSEADRIKFTVPIDDPLLFMLHEPKLRQEIIPNFMFRVVDAAALIGQYRFAAAESPTGSRRLKLRLSDDHAEWNRGNWTIVISRDGMASVSRSETSEEREESEEESETEICVACDIRIFSTMMIGCQRPSQLAAIGNLTGSAAAIAEWERAIPATVPFLTDMF